MSGKLIALSCVGAVAMIGAAAFAQPVAEGGRKFTTELTGEAEVNANGPNAGDLDGTGTAHVTVNPGQRRICYEISVANIAAPTRGHIHRGAVGTNGGIVVGFFEADADEGAGAVSFTVISLHAMGLPGQ